MKEESDELQSLVDPKETHSLLGVHKLPESPVNVSNLFTPNKSDKDKMASTSFTTVPIPNVTMPSVTPEKGDIMTAMSSSSSSYVPHDGVRPRCAFVNVRTQRPSLDDSNQSP